MKRTAQEKVKIEFPAQGAQLAGYAMQNLLSHADRAAKAGDDAAHRGDLSLDPPRLPPDTPNPGPRGGALEPSVCKPGMRAA